MYVYVYVHVCVCHLPTFCSGTRTVCVYVCVCVRVYVFHSFTFRPGACTVCVCVCVLCVCVCVCVCVFVCVFVSTHTTRGISRTCFLLSFSLLLMLYGLMGCDLLCGCVCWCLLVTRHMLVRVVARMTATELLVWLQLMTATTCNNTQQHATTCNNMIWYPPVYLTYRYIGACSCTHHCNWVARMTATYYCNNMQQRYLIPSFLRDRYWCV